MTKLPLAVDIADAVIEAGQQAATLDIEMISEQLHQAHPEAEASRAEIAETLEEEASAGQQA